MGVVVLDSRCCLTVMFSRTLRRMASVVREGEVGWSVMVTVAAPERAERREGRAVPGGA